MLILQSVQAGFQSLEPYKNSLLLALVILLIVKRRETKLQGSERSAPSGLGGISPTLKAAIYYSVLSLLSGLDFFS